MTSLVLYGLLGLALAALTYGGLWWTARRLAASRSPLRLIALSFVLRSLPVIAVAIVLALRGEWWGLVTTAAAFVVARLVLSFFYGNVPGLR